VVQRWGEDNVATVPFWWHSIALPGGIVTPGHKSAKVLEAELAQLRLPDLPGRSVLDIGAWDGWFSFAAERLGASRVVAMDYYTWSMDLPRQQAYYRDCLDKGGEPEPFESRSDLWRPDELPGKAGFDLAHRLLDSQVEAAVGDFMTIDLDQLGRFDVVLFLGVLYHLRHPLLALERLAQVTAPGGSAFIETEAIVVPDGFHPSMCEFYESTELAGDPTCWWSPSPAALEGMCRTAGFRHVELLNQPPSRERYRAVARADV
jgi:tRNA (mo5U34)-methyltransferase